LAPTRKSRSTTMEPPQPPADATQPQRQPPAVLTVWTEHLLRRSAAPHVACLLKVAGELGMRAYGREGERLHDALRSLAEDLVGLDYGRVTHADGRPRNPPDLAGFTVLYQQVSAALEPTDALTAELEAWLQTHAGSVRRAQVELKMEEERLEAALAYGDSWIADIWADLKERRPLVGDRAALDDLRQLAQTADRLGNRIKTLHGASRAARDACESAELVMSARRALVQMLRVDLRRTRLTWMQAVDQLLRAAATRKVKMLPLPALAQADIDLRGLLERCIAECTRMRKEQRALQRSLATACELLRAAMPAAPPPVSGRQG
jgi:hypothetical protein